MSLGAIKVVISYKDETHKAEHLEFNSALDLLDYQLSLSLDELKSIEAFDVYPT